MSVTPFHIPVHRSPQVRHRVYQFTGWVELRKHRELWTKRKSREKPPDWLLDQLLRLYSRRPPDLPCYKPTPPTFFFPSSSPHSQMSTHMLDQPPLTTGCLFAPRNLHSAAYGATGLPVVRSPSLARLQRVVRHSPQL